jgi:hypothetical protein
LLLDIWFVTGLLSYQGDFDVLWCSSRVISVSRVTWEDQFDDSPSISRIHYFSEWGINFTCEWFLIF